jgi:hypothetical protein
VQTQALRRSSTPLAIGAALLAISLFGCAAEESAAPMTLDSRAEAYVHLVLALGEHDADYVDAYIGPAEWREQAKSSQLGLEEIERRAREASAGLSELSFDNQLEELRARHLEKSFDSLLARVAMLSGERLSFDEESLALYDAVAPARGAEHYQGVLYQLEEALPPKSPIEPQPLVDRYAAFRSDFIVPPDRLDAVLTAAIDACREKTRAYVDLPESEAFTVEYVTDKSWSGYNWYQGEYQSLIQINTDLPIYVDRMLDLACHEGYPGHHVYNLIVERDLVGENGWIEFAVYPLFSPRSLIAEGSANYGIEVAFPEAERLAFEREVLFPLAGLEVDRADEYYRILDLAAQLDHAGNEAARDYLDGKIDAEQAAEWLSTYSMMAPERAEQRVRFIDQYRSYVINYNLGMDLVRQFIEGRGGSADDPERRWQEFNDLLASPRLPSQLGP